MKNLVLAILATYIFWTDMAVIHPLPVLPIIVLLIWATLVEIDDVITDYKKRIREGRRLQRRIKRMEREVR